METKYNIEKIKQDLQDEYMAANLVGFTEDTPDIMDIEFSNPKEIIAMAERYGLKMEDYVIEDKI